jgi:uncharacterized protein (UPF0335 family)
MINKIELAQMSQEALINLIEQLITRIERLEKENEIRKELGSKLPSFIRV